MKRASIKASALLVKWKKLYQGQRCGHMFCDVIFRGGPKITYETIASSLRQCEGTIEVGIEEGREWENIEHKELVWRKMHYNAEFLRVRITRKCPICGAGEKSNWFRDEEPVRRVEKTAEWDDIPF